MIEKLRELKNKYNKPKPVKKAKKQIGLSLRGGGARAFSYIGVLYLFEENNIKIDSIIGSGTGALIGGLYSIGLPLNDILKIGTKILNLSQSSLSTILNGKIFNDGKISNIINDSVKDKSIEETEIQFSIQLTNSKNNSPVIIETGSLSQYLIPITSHCLTVDPFNINGNEYTDAYYSSGYGTEYLRNVQKCTNVIGCDCGFPLVETDYSNLSHKITDLHYRFYNTLLNFDKHLHKLDFEFENLAGNEGYFTDVNLINDFAEKGYQTAKKYEGELLNIIKKF